MFNVRDSTVDVRNSIFDVHNSKVFGEDTNHGANYRLKNEHRTSKNEHRIKPSEDSTKCEKWKNDRDFAK
jgi:hypothetical protein